MIKELSRTASNGNDVVVTQSGSLSTYFTWKLVHRNSYEEYCVYADNRSTSPYFLSFTISVGSGSATAGWFDGPSGEYDYYLYESATQYNITPSGTPINVGLLYVSTTASNIAVFTQSDSQTVVYYNNLD